MSSNATATRSVGTPGGRTRPAIVLASGSRTRAVLLERAGISCLIEPAVIDEEATKLSLRREGVDGGGAAAALAELKAVKISRRHSGAFVVGADQLLECDGRWFDKPADIKRARAQLLALRGKPHDLISAVVVTRDGVRLWHHIDRARLHMRAFSDAFLDDYLNKMGAAACESVGAYQLEGLGAQLFSRVEGDYFTVLGLPLLPLLDFLRTHDVVPE